MKKKRVLPSGKSYYRIVEEWDGYLPNSVKKLPVALSAWVCLVKDFSIKYHLLRQKWIPV